MHLARRGLLWPRWTERILDEYARNLVRRSEARHEKDPAKPVIPRVKVDELIHLMNLHQPQALLDPVSAAEAACFERVSEEDRHVAAAARSARLALGFDGTLRSVDARARTGETPVDPPLVGVVTENVDDFPADAMAMEGLFALRTDDFLLAVLAWSGREMVAALAAHAVGLARPSLDVDGYLVQLRRANLSRTAEAVEEHLRLVVPAARTMAERVLKEGRARAGRKLTHREEDTLRQAAYDAAYEAAAEAARLAGIP